MKAGDTVVCTRHKSGDDDDDDDHDGGDDDADYYGKTQLSWIIARVPYSMYVNDLSIISSSSFYVVEWMVYSALHVKKSTRRKVPPVVYMTTRVKKQ